MAEISMGSAGLHLTGHTSDTIFQRYADTLRFCEKRCSRMGKRFTTDDTDDTDGTDGFQRAILPSVPSVKSVVLLP